MSKDAKKTEIKHICSLSWNKCNIIHESSDEERWSHFLSGRKMTTFLAQISLDPMCITKRLQRICVDGIHEDEGPL